MLGPELDAAGPTPTCCASARCRRRSARSAVSSPGPAALRRARREPRAARTSSRPRRRRPTPRPRSRRCGSCARPKATRSSPGCARTSTGCARATRRRSSRSSAATSSDALDAAAALLDRRPPRARDPAADRRARHVAPARHAVGRAHRRAGRHAARARSPTCSASVRAAVTGIDRRRRRHRHRRRQDLRRPRRCCGRCARDGIAVAARKPVQSFAPGRPRPTDADVLARRDRRGPARRVPAASLAPAADGAADGRRRARAPAVHRRRPRRRELASVTDATRSRSSRASGGVRSPLAADGDTVGARRRARPALVVLVADAGLGTINLVRLSVERARANSASSSTSTASTRADELHVRNRDWLATREGLDVVTDLEALATFVERRRVGDGRTSCSSGSAATARRSCRRRR